MYRPFEINIYKERSCNFTYYKVISTFKFNMHAYLTKLIVTWKFIHKYNIHKYNMQFYTLLYNLMQYPMALSNSTRFFSVMTSQNQLTCFATMMSSIPGHYP